MENKKQITVLCGGQSAEHEISILSANNVINALDKQKYIVSVIYISQQGKWHRIKNIKSFLKDGPQVLLQKQEYDLVTVALGESLHPFVSLDNTNQRYATDCILPILHGTLSEDGTLQGMLDLLNVAYVGSGMLSCALTMNKHITKSLLRFADIPTANWQTLYRKHKDKYSYQQIAQAIGQKFFLKPVSLGSSIGVSKVVDEKQFKNSLEIAFHYDDIVLAEKYIPGREIECSVIGNEEPIVSLPGEIKSHHEFYSYEAKYLDPNGADVIAPADLPEAIVEKVKDIATKAYSFLQCEGMARIDFFLTKDNDVLVNELNPIPGFTNISMYPKLWSVSGISISEILDNLISLALARYHSRQNLSRVRLIDENFQICEDFRAKGLE